MFYKTLSLFLILSLISTITFCQSSKSRNSLGNIQGRVFDSQTNTPVEFSNIILYSSKDSTQVTGTVTGKKGYFYLNKLTKGNYYLEVRYIGYTSKNFDNIKITGSGQHINLGNIYLKPSAINLRNVMVQGKRSPISFDLDKQVIDVSQLHTSLSGSAADVLENVPSVSVDIDGNVSLRGSTNFQVLINGQPSVLSAQDALQQIPASSIKNIEIITNPSAKYDASGTAGVINIILKKNTNLGLSGIADVMGGLNNKYGINFIAQYKTRPVNYNFGAYFNKRFYPGSNTQQKQFIIGDNTSYLNSNGNIVWGRTFTGVRGGLDLNINKMNTLSFGGRYGWRSFQRNSLLNYDKWTNYQPQKIYYLNNTGHVHSGNFFDLNSNYKHKFGTGDNKLTAEFFYRHNNSDENSHSAASIADNLFEGTKTTELGPESELRGKADYDLPLGGREKFSAGAEYFRRLRQDINKLYMFDSTNSAYDFKPQFSNTNDFNRTRFAAYTLLSNHWDSLGVQIGARAEYTYQLVKLVETDQQFSLNRWDFFPSLHASYNLSGGTQIMASYSRRINRPDGRDLEPFYTWFDANNVYLGNPSIKPELIDSYELGYQTYFGKVSFSNDFYYRYTHDKIEHYSSVYAENVSLRSVANVGNDKSLGAEFMLMFKPVKIWHCNLMGDLYDYKIQGALFNQSFARESFDWRVKFNNSVNITPSTELDLNTRYYSPSVNAQGKWEGFFTTDMALKQNIMGKHISLILQVRDLFRTGKREFITQGTDFYNYFYYSRKSPMVMFNIKYNFNNYKDNSNINNSAEED